MTSEDPRLLIMSRQGKKWKKIRKMKRRIIMRRKKIVRESRLEDLLLGRQRGKEPLEKLNRAHIL